MKQKISTLIEKDIMRLAKRRAADEGRSISDLIQEALVHYVTSGSGNPKEREMAYHLFCARPFKLMAGQLKRVLKEDAWDS